MKVILSIICVLFCGVLSAQEYWVNEYDLSDREQEYGKELAVVDSLIVVTGGFSCDDGTKPCHKFSVFDMSGNLQYFTTDDSLLHNFPNPSPRGLVIMGDRFITIGRSIRSSNEFCVIAQNITGEVLQRKFVENPYDSTLAIEPKYLLEHDGSLVLIANIFGEVDEDSPYGFIYQLAVYTIDPNTFEVVNELIIKPNEYIVDIKDAMITPDNHLLLALRQREALESGASNHRSQLLKIDASLEIIDSMITQDTIYYDDDEKIAIGHDGRVVMARKGSGVSFGRNELWIFDMTTKTIEKRSYDVYDDPGNGVVNYKTYGVISDKFESLYLFGSIQGNSQDYTNCGFFQKLDDDYNVIKERIFISNVNETLTFSNQDGRSNSTGIIDMYFSEDNEIYMTGFINDSYAEGGVAYNDYNILLGKLDADGCTITDCEVEKYTGGAVKPDHLVLPNKTWHIYNETTQEVYRYRLSVDSHYIADRYYLELMRSDSFEGDDFYTTGLYLRERSHLVYLRKDNADFLLYDFDHQINGRMKSNIYERFEASHESLERDSIILENGEKVRRVKLRCSIDEDAEDYGYYYWIEGVGDTKGLLAVGEACIDGRESHLLCAYDGDGNIIWDNPDFAGCWTTVSTEDESKEVSLISPNPTTGFIKIEDFSNYDKVIIHNMLGQLIMEEEISPELDISILDKGSYIMTLKGRTHSYTQILIKL